MTDLMDAFAAHTTFKPCTRLTGPFKTTNPWGFTNRRLYHSYSAQFKKRDIVFLVSPIKAGDTFPSFSIDCTASLPYTFQSLSICGAQVLDNWNVVMLA
jgi:hypothetical protein